MQFYSDRAAAIRNFFGNITEAEWPQYKCNVWYIPTKNRCQAFEPAEKDDDGFTVALSHDTLFQALFNKPLESKSEEQPRKPPMHAKVRNNRK